MAHANHRALTGQFASLGEPIGTTNLQAQRAIGSGSLAIRLPFKQGVVPQLQFVALEQITGPLGAQSEVALGGNRVLIQHDELLIGVPARTAGHHREGLGSQALKLDRAFELDHGPIVEHRGTGGRQLVFRAAAIKHHPLQVARLGQLASEVVAGFRAGQRPGELAQKIPLLQIERAKHKWLGRLLRGRPGLAASQSHSRAKQDGTTTQPWVTPLPPHHDGSQARHMIKGDHRVPGVGAPVGAQGAADQAGAIPTVGLPARRKDRVGRDR